MRNNSDTNFEGITKAVQRISNLLLIVFVLALLTIAVLLATKNKSSNGEESAGPKPDKDGLFTESARQALERERSEKARYWQALDTVLLAGLKDAALIKYGKKLITNTAFYFGENGSVAKRSTNGMNCQNCHLEAGTKTWGNNFSAVLSTYPKYRARSGKIETISKRINDCFERSLNGKALDTASKEMKAIIAYITWLCSSVRKGEKPAGSGFQKIAYLSEAASVVKGKQVYIDKCMACHGPNGEGRENKTAGGYTYPPLWGPHSYNSGAGLLRLANFASFVKYNMPFGLDYLSTQLSNEEAWDVAAFVNSQARPSFDVQHDWPKLHEKPIDLPFGPFADEFSEQQHKYGPFLPIIAKRELLVKKRL